MIMQSDDIADLACMPAECQIYILLLVVRLLVLGLIKVGCAIYLNCNIPGLNVDFHWTTTRSVVDLALYDPVVVSKLSELGLQLFVRCLLCFAGLG